MRVKFDIVSNASLMLFIYPKLEVVVSNIFNDQLNGDKENSVAIQGLFENFFSVYCNKKKKIKGLMIIIREMRAIENNSPYVHLALALNAAHGSLKDIHRKYYEIDLHFEKSGEFRFDPDCELKRIYLENSMDNMAVEWRKYSQDEVFAQWRRVVKEILDELFLVDSTSDWI